MRMRCGSSAAPVSRLLGDDDPHPVEWVNRDSDAGVLLLCEHAGKQLPQSHALLGLSNAELDSHIGWDIGAARLARQLAGILQAPLILQRYSRLLIDCNRPPGSESSIPQISGGITIPANLKVCNDEIKNRQTEVFEPLDLAIQQALERFPRKAVFSIHSFTPKMNDQPQRPWHAGFLSRTDHSTGNILMASIHSHNPELILAMNQPYSIDDEGDWFIPRYAETRNLSHCLIEIRNDQLLDNKGIDTWASLLASAIESVMEKLA